MNNDQLNETHPVPPLSGRASNTPPDKGEKEGVSGLCPSCAEYLAGWKRAQADYQNLVKDTERERREFVNFANEQLFHELLPALDQLATALGSGDIGPALEQLGWER